MGHGGRGRGDDLALRKFFQPLFTEQLRDTLCNATAAASRGGLLVARSPAVLLRTPRSASKGAGTTVHTCCDTARERLESRMGCGSSVASNPAAKHPNDSMPSPDKMLQQAKLQATATTPSETKPAHNHSQASASVVKEASPRTSQDTRKMEQCSLVDSSVQSTTQVRPPWPQVEALIKACTMGQVDNVRQTLMAQGSPAATRNLILAGDWRGRSAVHAAAAAGQVACLAMLLNFGGADGAAAAVADLWKQTPLHVAAETGNRDTIALLLDRGADINTLDVYGETALVKAAHNGHTTSVQLLLDHSADSALQDAEGGTAFLYAQRRGHKAIVVLLQAA